MAIGLLTVLPYTLAMMFVIKDLDAVRSSRLPSLEVFYQATGSHSAALGLQGLLVVLYYSKWHVPMSKFSTFYLIQTIKEILN